MARETSYFVQAFDAGRGGSLKAMLRSSARRKRARVARPRDWR